ncbi:cellulase family glycosylhydrolase, partial [Xanthomonas campestris]|uniref:cellulase family glycosylhydrolase n=1 Tax=Xanthomonas campestris TaxID=339 RepID=UPI00403A08CA
PLERYALVVHQYLVTDSRGSSAGWVRRTVCAERLRSFTGWLRAQGKRGILGQFSTANNATGTAGPDGMLCYLETNHDVWIGWTFWAAGAWWNTSYPFNVQPAAQGRDKPQMKTLSARAHRVTR